MSTQNSFDVRATLEVADRSYTIYRLRALEEHYPVASLPFCLKILLENLLRHEDGDSVTRAHIQALADWEPTQPPQQEIAFTPARVLMQDFTGVPAIVDLAAMRDAVTQLGGDPGNINPLSPAELVIDHSVQVDHYGQADAAARNATIEFERNRERYEFLRWGQQAFNNLKVVPPDTGIVHQVNLEHLARGIFSRKQNGNWIAYPDTLVGTDSHTTMINGLGVLGWGVGGIEAEAAMLGQPISMLIPAVVGMELSGRLAEGVTATDLVLTVTEQLRQHGVVGKFVEFFGSGLAQLPLADRATIANMAPEYGATCGLFPIDQEMLDYLRLSGRPAERLQLVESYAQTQGLWHDANSPPARYSEVVSLDMSTVEPSLAGPKRPQDRIALRQLADCSRDTVREMSQGRSGPGSVTITPAQGAPYELTDGAVTIAAITSCTNTSNPSVMIGAGLLARKARAHGLQVKPWVKTSLAPGSLVVRNYLQHSGLLEHLEALGFHIVGFGCTTCIGNSGPLPAEISQAIQQSQLVTAAVLSGNRNFEGRVHPEISMNFLASPPLVIAYALAGTTHINLQEEPLGTGPDGTPVYLRDIWPSRQEIDATFRRACDPAMYADSYRGVYDGDSNWNALQVPEGMQYLWQEHSGYVRKPPFFIDIQATPPGLMPIREAQVLALLGDSITTDHISPAGTIPKDSPAGRYLLEQGVQQRDFNSYGSRRGNHEVMMRGTFANIRLQNLLAPGKRGGWTTHIPSGEVLPIYDAAMRYQQDKVALIVVAGREYGTGSSRDWAAKGTCLLGVRAVLASSFERIHRSNLVGMGVLPLALPEGETAASAGISGHDPISIGNLQPGMREVALTIHTDPPSTCMVRVRVDTPKEWEYMQHGGILPYVLRKLAR